MAQERFNLKWDDFQTNISRSLKDIRSEDDFCDVTLVGDDNQQVSAHKVILATSSQYFKKVLKQNKHPNPLLCLWGLNHNDLKHILDYIYFGEVKLIQEELNRFLEVAQKLELDGAVQASNLKSVETSVVTNEFYMTPEEDESKNLKSEVLPKYDEPPIILQSERPEDLAELDKLVSTKFSRTLDNLFQCNHCPKNFTSTSHAKDHAETHIAGLNFLCK